MRTLLLVLAGCTSPALPIACGAHAQPCCSEPCREGFCAPSYCDDGLLCASVDDELRCLRVDEIR